MRIACWTPLLPEACAAARESHLLLSELARHFEVIAVVRDEATATTVVPDGIVVVGRSDYGPYGIDLDLYHVANGAREHLFAHAQALRRPGVLVLHEPALWDLYARLCGGPTRPLFGEAVREETGEALEGLATIDVEGVRRPDPLAALFSPRLVTASLCTFVDSTWARDELARRCPGAVIEVVPRAVSGTPATGVARGSRVEIVLAVHDASPSQVGHAAAAIGRVGERLSVLTVVHGPGQAFSAALVETGARAAGFRGPVEALEAPLAPLGDDALSALLGRADLVVSLAWPTFGATSPLVAAALVRGTPVLTSDLGQYRDLDSLAVHRVSTDPVEEVRELEAFLSRPDLAAILEERRGPARRLGRAFAPDAVARRYDELIGRLGDVAALRRHRYAKVPDASWPPAVNAIASFEATTGLTEAARRTVDALVHAGVRVAIEDYDYGAPRQAHRMPQALRRLPQGRPYDIEICFLNVNELHALKTTYLRIPHRPRYVIASWFWELPELPRSMRDQIGRVDEIWAPSRFVGDAFAQVTDKPVRIIPCVVEPALDASLRRADFGLADDKLVYFFQFDVKSTVARKNPFGIIEAFRKAFAGRDLEHVQLVMKTINLDRLPEAASLLRSAIASVGGVIVEEDLAPEAMAALTACCDVYVSLHRGEGFGLGPAEAMYFGRPVIATAYSGNLDFMSASNSCLVGYSMTQVTLGELRYNPGTEAVYEPGQYWADPNLDEAASWMRYLYEHGEARARIGAAGKVTVRHEYSRAGVGARMREILEQIRPL